MNNAVQLITIKEKVPLFKGDEKAERIELILLEENGFELVSQKNLYQVGDKAIYIQPDYCVPYDSLLFDSFVRPNGDESKSMLGKVGGLPRRIRAKKFNFHKGDGNSIYSNGILLSFDEVGRYLESSKNINIWKKNYDFNDLTTDLEIKKYEELEKDVFGSNIKGGSSIRFPEGIVRTDEENFNNLIHHIEKLLPTTLIGKMKIDGSSITLWYKNGKFGIASRNLGKPLTITKVTGRRKKTLLEKILFWKTFDLNIYEEVECDSDFVKYGKPYLDKLVKYCEENKVNLVLQGELCGKGMKGSGNKNNPHSQEETDIIFFNVCKYEHQSIRLSELDFQKICQDLNLPSSPLYFSKQFNTIQEIKDECESIFNKQLIEGIVLRDENHNFSCKYMNNEYDSKK